MNKLLTTLLALGVASVTVMAHAQAAHNPASAPAGAASTGSAGTAHASGSASIESKVAMCMGCHNIKGYQASFPEVHKVPKIAGQSAKYIVAALTAYKQGDRKHPTMRSIAQSLTDEDIVAIAAHYEAEGKHDNAALPAKADKEPNAQVAGLLKKAACTSCHGDNFAKPIDPSYPVIAGQHSDYLFVALKAYKAENNANVGRSNAVMGAIAKQFSYGELKALAGYVSSLEGPLKTVPEARFR